jgi:hypothetical protein
VYSIQHYVIMFVGWLAAVRWFSPGTPVSYVKSWLSKRIFSLIIQLFTLPQYHCNHLNLQSSIQCPKFNINMSKLQLQDKIFAIFFYYKNCTLWIVCDSLLEESILFKQLHMVIPIIPKVASSNPVHGDVYSMQHNLIKFVSNLRQVRGFLRVLRFPSPIKLTAKI